jgi:DNA-binding NarL/FixJ family response regulator
MILAAVDDMLFRSKIRTTAKLAGLDVVFARTPEEIMSQVRALGPTLVIFDLNSPKTQSVATVSAMKHDAELASVRTLGFVSHVDSDVIRDARAAGIDEIMARSAFSMRLEEILLAADSGPGTRD